MSFKYSFLIFSFLLLLSSNAWSSYVIKMNNGDVYRGEIVEDVKDEYIQLRFKNGNEKRLNYKEIKSTKHEGNNTEDTVKKDKYHHVEDWYYYFGFGISGIDYGNKSTNDFIDKYKSDLSYTRIPMNMAFLGFYWPMENNKTMHGFNLEGIIESYSRLLDNKEASIYQLIYSYSLYHFFGDYIGKGFFLRADLGLVATTISEKGNNNVFTEERLGGYGYVAGIGYGFPLNNETRMLIQFFYTNVSADYFKSSSSNLTLSFLF